MPQPPLSPQERRLQGFCRWSAAAYFAAALACAAAPWFTDGGASGLMTCWNALATSLMTCAGTACLVTAAQPRERRHALLPVVVAQFTACLLALLHFGARGQALVLGLSAPLLLVTLFIYRSAAPGVHSGPAREGPSPQSAPAPPVALGIKKAN